MDVGYFISALLTIFSGIAIYKLICLIKDLRTFLKFFKDAPSPRDFHWFYGNAHLFMKKTPDDRIKLMEEISKEYPRYFVLWMSPLHPILFLNHPETIKVIFKTAEPKSRTTGAGYKDMLPWLGEGLLIAEGSRWARSRRLLTPAFHFEVLKPYMEVFNDSSDILTEKLTKYADSGESLELFELLSSCTLDVMLKCVFSYETGCQKNGETHPYVKAVYQLARTISQRMVNIFLSIDFIFKLSSEGKLFRQNCDFVHTIADDVIKKRKAKLNEIKLPSKKNFDFLDVLIKAKDENGNGLTDLEIRNEVDTFLFEGHDTTASGISWVLYFLAKYPKHQEKVQEEIDIIVNGKEDHRIGWDDLPKMEYLTKCIKEGMRICSPVPGVGRQTTKEFVIDGKRFPPQTTVFLTIYLLHRNSTVWKDPLTFDPERFNTENITEKDPYAYCPFAAGPRNCIGQHFAMNEMKVVIARLLYRYHMELDFNHRVLKDPALTLRAENGIKVHIKRRR